MKKVLLAMISGLMISGITFGQMSGTYYIPSGGTPSYASIQAAINDLNINGINSSVTFLITPGYTETAPSGGLLLGSTVLNANTSLTNTITFQKNGGGTNPLITAFTPGTSLTVDGIWKIQGTDYVTIDGIDLQENALNTSATQQMEWGYALVKLRNTSPFDGCQYVTIKNCTITLNKANTGSVGIYAGNHIATATTSLIILATTDALNNCKFYGNTITNSYAGISINGYSAASPYTLYDQNNEVGVTAANTITNFGGSTVSARAIYGIYQKGVKVVGNNISSSLVGSTTTVYGVFLSTGTSSSADINNNTISISLATGTYTSTVYGINNAMGSTAASNTININNNIFQNCDFSGFTTGNWYAILNSGTATTVNINNNTINNITMAGTGATSYVIEMGSPVTGNMNGNNITNITRTGAGGTQYGLKITSPTNLTANGNTVDGISYTNTASTGTVYGFYGLSSAVNVTVTNNIFRNFLTPTTGSLYGIREFGVSGTKNIQNNQVYNFSTYAGGAGGASMYGIYCSTGNIDISNNLVYTLNSTGTTGGTAGGIYGIYISGGNTNNIYKNKLYDLSSASSNPVVSGILIAGGSTNTVYNNLVGDLRTPAANAANPLIGISVTGGTTANLYYNTVWLEAVSTGALFGSSALSASTTPNLTLINNIFTNYSTPNGAGLTVAYRRSTTTLTTYQNASNNNDFHGLYPATIYYDGTTAYAFPAFQVLVGPVRDAASFSVLPPYLSFVGSAPTFLHINPLTPTPLESGASDVGIGVDYDGNIRQGYPGYPPQSNGGGAAPDVGADEFDGFLIPVPKTLSLITYNQASTSAVPQGTTNAEILRLDFAVAGNSGTLFLNSIVVNSLNTSDADVTSVKLYRTSTTTFSTANPLGSTTTFSGGNATFLSLSYDLPPGTTYVWAAYDVSASATITDILDAQIQSNQIDVAGTTYPTSAQSPTGSRSIVIGPITSFPFTENFEGGNFNNWIVVNGTQTNQWAVGTATNNGGSYSAYVSNDGGITNAYTITATSVTHFYRDITFPSSGEFHLAFNWKGVGETSLYDYLRVFLVDVTTTPVAGTLLTSGQIGSDYYNQATWQSVDLTFASGNLGTTKRLVFSWRNDLSLGTQPPAAIDNIQIYQAANMAYSSSTTTQNSANTVAGATNQQIIGIQVVTTGSVSPISVSKFTVNANGTTSVSDILNAKIFYTGTSSTFNTTTQFGSTYATPTIADFDITTVTPQTLSTGTNYFWLTFDIASGATANYVVDAECKVVTVGGADYVPTITAPSGSRKIAGPLAGDYTVGTAKGDYTTLTAAIADLNLLGISDNVNFILTDPTYSASETFPIVINSVVGVSSSKKVTIKPNTSVAATITGSSATALLKLYGADYIIIDGLNTGGSSLTFNNISASGVDLWLSCTPTDGANYNVVKNCTFLGTAGTGTIAGVLAGSGTTLGNSAEAANSNNTVQNNIFKSTQNGIYINGYATAPYDQNWVVSNNTFGSTVAAEKHGFRGMLIGNASNFTVSNNTIIGVLSSTSSSSTMSGIQVGLAVAGGKIFSNIIGNISQVNTTGWGANGIYLAASTTASAIDVYNNVIYDVTGYGYNGVLQSDNGYGIMIQSGGGYNLYNNSVNMYTSQTSLTGIPAAINISSGITTVGSIKLQNNIFNIPSTNTTGTRYAIYCGAANTVFSDINYNDYYSVGTLGYLGSAITTITAWRTATGKDVNSINADPLYTTATNLLPQNTSPVIGVAQPLPGVVDFDILGNARGAATTMGAYELISTTIPTALTWTGVVSNSWHNPLNWNSTSTVPGTTTNVTIPVVATNYPTLTANGFCNTLYMQSGTSILDNGYLTLTNAASGVTVDRTIGCDQYHSYSPSVSGATAGIFHLSGSTGLDVFLYGHQELNNANSEEGYFEIVPLNTPLAPMTGYASLS